MRALAILSIAVATTLSPLAAEVDFATVPAELLPVYEAQRGDIETLVVTASAPDGDDAARAEALELLQLRYPYLSVSVAREVALAGGPQVQLAATEIVANSVVMMNHPMDDHGAHAQYESSIEVLQQIVAAGTPEARDVAAQTGTSLGEEAILQEIRTQNAEGALDDTSAVAYLTLAEPEIAAEYVSPYLTSDSVAAQSQAVSYLGSLPAYQTEIRDGYLFDVTKPDEVQAAAARVLARTDTTFDSYAANVVERAGVPIGVLDAVIQGALENQANPVSLKQIEGYDVMVLNYQRLNPNADMLVLENLRNQLSIIE